MTGILTEGNTTITLKRYFYNRLDQVNIFFVYGKRNNVEATCCLWKFAFSFAIYGSKTKGSMDITNLQ